MGWPREASRQRRSTSPTSAARRRVPDRAPVLEQAWRDAIAAAHAQFQGLPLFIGGKSMGGRIASHVASQGGVGTLAGLVFLGYPLHPPGRPDQRRDAHLPAIAEPMLFVQGSRDAFGTADELRAADALTAARDAARDRRRRSLVQGSGGAARQPAVLFDHAGRGGGMGAGEDAHVTGREWRASTVDDDGSRCPPGCDDDPWTRSRPRGARRGGARHPRRVPWLHGTRGAADGAAPGDPRLLPLDAGLDPGPASLLPRPERDEVVASWMTRQDRDAAIADNVAYVDAALGRGAARRRHADRVRGILPGGRDGFSRRHQRQAWRGRRDRDRRRCAAGAPGGRHRNVPTHPPGARHARRVADSGKVQIRPQCASRPVVARVRALEFEGGHEWNAAVAEAAGDFLESI